ncbi:MAG: YicC/YloC family endoribonuclease [Candidatus Omnitrophota bacterium]
MIRSMTGFGKASEKSPYGRIIVEIKTLNHKSLSILCTSFDGFFLMEEKITKVLEKEIVRGKTFIKISREDMAKQKMSQKIEVNKQLAAEYIKKIKSLQKELGLAGEVEIQWLIDLPGVLKCEAEQKEDILWPYIRKAMEKALVKTVSYRKSEGIRLSRDFNSRLRKIQADLDKIKKYDVQSVDKYRKKLISSVKEASKKIEPDRGRIETEVAVFARNCDIAEEITRLTGHLREYKKEIDNIGTDAGKKMDFIAQEMQREANTIGAKASDFRISKAVINIKSEIEKIREQVKNIE